MYNMTKKNPVSHFVDSPQCPFISPTSQSQISKHSKTYSKTRINTFQQHVSKMESFITADGVDYRCRIRNAVPRLYKALNCLKSNLYKTNQVDMLLIQYKKKKDILTILINHCLSLILHLYRTVTWLSSSSVADLLPIFELIKLRAYYQEDRTATLLVSIFIKSV